MKVIGILLIILGIIGIVMGGMMFGDIGIVCIVGAMSALLSGIGFLIASKRSQMNAKIKLPQLQNLIYLSHFLPLDFNSDDIKSYLE